MGFRKPRRETDLRVARCVADDSREILGESHSQEMDAGRSKISETPGTESTRDTILSLFRVEDSTITFLKLTEKRIMFHNDEFVVRQY